ncbi:low-specificity L-threonine aldolase [Dehalogenimonas etheniformans]|uniref:Low-specificity L-threonine aldolase n=1 Tax=Dehalogenimonas etheniformans TaxID=1536648 RepID=A0A2P5P7A5_9CHLR|nr:low-specificity L-threonine aldolase [Dehalogenimonas etheniformans]PPD58183.1 low-specificity L-threonine aldolase [Dehalogenimonas etheniformans]QNT77083.1 low-specificity L-threonine aldolase [Dehalogenimonas etheniformans]
MQIIDLRSDTITHPTQEMRDAMYRAEVGDDVFGEDPTVNRLEALAAEITGKEAAVFTPSGTMSNLIAVLSHTRHGDEIILGDRAHIFLNEAGGAAAIGGVSLRTVPNNSDGTIDIDRIEAAVRGIGNLHWPPSKLLCLENTHNYCGGAVLDVEYTTEAGEAAHRHGLAVHLDGARLFNAAVALGVAPVEICEPVDSVNFCLSKGLSAPIGSVLCGSAEFIARARKFRKMVGGGMRQAGVIAAAGIVCLEHCVDRLEDDHTNAKTLAEGLTKIPGLNVEKPETNIVMIGTPENLPAADFIKKAAAVGVKMISVGPQRVRAVTHRMVNAADIVEAVKRLEKALGHTG